MAIKRDIGTLDSIPISRHGFSIETGSKQTDLTPVLLLVPDPVPVADLAHEIAGPEHALVADLAHTPVKDAGTVFSLWVRRVLRIFDRHGGAARESTRRRAVD